MRGRLIVVEGLDGTGKTTLSRGLAEATGARWMTTPGEDVRRVRSVIDDAYVDHPVAAQLFYASTVVAVSGEADRTLDDGRDVVIDRYWLTTAIYALARGRSLPLASVQRLLLRPDVTILVDLEERERVRRLVDRGASTLDLTTVESSRAAALRRAYQVALRRTIAGTGVRLDVTGLSPPEALGKAMSVLGETLPHRVRTTPRAVSTGAPSDEEATLVGTPTSGSVVDETN